MATSLLACRPSSFAATLAPFSFRRSALSIRGSASPILHFSSPLRSISAYTDSSAAAPTDLAGEEIKLEWLEVGGGEGDGGGNSEGGGNGGSGGGSDGEGGPEDREGKKMRGMSMSQKLTLGYAVLVGVGGVMGYMKSGSKKSLAAGLLSAFLLYYVQIQLPSKTTFASSIGLGTSAALLGVMGSRFKKSRKIFPAGVVSVVSFVMAGGYLHGILRSLHI